MSEKKFVVFATQALNPSISRWSAPLAVGPEIIGRASPTEGNWRDLLEGQKRAADVFHNLPSTDADFGGLFRLTDATGAALAKAHGLSTMPYPNKMPIRLIAQVATAAVAGPGSPWGIAAVGADRQPLKGEGICVAVLDTGIDRTHPAFAGLIRDDNSNYMDFTHTSLSDTAGHGTHCAGIIFGRDVNGVRIGVAPGISNVLIGKIADNDVVMSTDQLHEALEWAVRLGADVISLSVGLDFVGHTNDLEGQGMPKNAALALALNDYRDYSRFFDALMTEISNTGRAGRSVLVVAAVGNDSEADLYPSCRVVATLPAVAAGVLSVGAVAQTPEGKLAVAPFSNGCPDICAPGAGILSAAPGGGTATKSGTSQAAPHAAAVAALWFQKLYAERGRRPDAETVRGKIIGTADDHALSSYNADDMGSGLIKAPNP